MKSVSFFIYITILLLTAGCDMTRYPEPESEQRPELLVYCGMTMIRPVMEISALFEEQEDCRVKITYGGSGHIMQSVQVNQVGDLFFPGKESYVRELIGTGSIVATSVLGYNVAGLFVQPGNPYQIVSDMKALLDPALNVVIGGPDSGSIGGETKRILDGAGIYQDVVEHALYMTTDSKGLVQALKNREADLVINWRAVYFAPDNKESMDFIPLPPGLAIKQPLLMGLLKYSRDPDLAKR